MKTVHTYADLGARSSLDEGHTKPAKLAVIGQPVAHSASPQLHQPALDALGIDARYIRLELSADEFRPALERMRDLGFIGCNVTVPHKFAALAACDILDPLAEALGAVNTIRFQHDGLHGFNTDGPGFCNALRDCFSGVLSGMTVAIVGAGGGAGQAIATQCVLSGAAKLVLINRTRPKLDALLDHLARFNRDTELLALGLDDPHLADACRSCHLIVNTSSVGLKEGDPSILPATCLQEGQCVYDTIYQPPVTPLLALAAHHGCRTANGLSMLIHQGALSFQHWFPGTEPLEWMKGIDPPKAD